MREKRSNTTKMMKKATKRTTRNMRRSQSNTMKMMKKAKSTKRSIQMKVMVQSQTSISVCRKGDCF